MGFVTMAVNNIFLTVFTSLMDKWALEGNEKGLLIYLNFGVWLVKNIFFAAIVFAGVYVGYSAVDAFVNSIPEVIMTGLNVCGQLLPAVGLALLMKMIWTKEDCCLLSSRIYSLYLYRTSDCCNCSAWHHYRCHHSIKRI